MQECNLGGSFLLVLHGRTINSGWKKFQFSLAAVSDDDEQFQFSL